MKVWLGSLPELGIWLGDSLSLSRVIGMQWGWGEEVCSGSGYLLKVEPAGFADGMHVGCETGEKSGMTAGFGSEQLRG